MTIRLALADDHPIVLQGLEQLFQLEPDVEVVARCRDGVEALRQVRELTPDVLVLDLKMPGRDGIEVLSALQEAGTETKVVLLTGALTDDRLLESLRLGVGGIVLKDMAPELLIQAVRKVAGGGRWLETGLGGRALSRLLARESAREEVRQALTPRELEIVRMVSAGLRNRAVADKLCISEGTVKVHLHNIYEKLSVTGRLELALYARNRGIV
jgi:DNA-binding NarL/FixJ family response regulator